MDIKYSYESADTNKDILYNEIYETEKSKKY